MLACCGGIIHMNMLCFNGKLKIRYERMNIIEKKNDSLNVKTHPCLLYLSLIKNRLIKDNLYK